MGYSLMKVGLPLISGFLLTGIIAGPYVLNLITRDAVVGLGFIDEISLGFIAFAAGGELYVKEFKSRMKSIAWVTAGLVVCTFTLVSVTFFFLTGYIPFMQLFSTPAKVAVSILAGAILVARSPSSAIAIVNELRARGPFTQTILGVTVIMDVVVIVLFAANSSLADALLTGLTFNFSFIVLLASEIGASLLVGFLVSKVLFGILLTPVHRAVKAGLILLTGFLVFFLSARLREFSHENFAVEILLEPLLICMVAGFFVSNAFRFRKEFLKILYDVGPIVYIIFFTMTGASLSLSVLAHTWPVALVLFFTRMAAIFMGSFIGGTLAKNPVRANSISWMAYITQAGVGLGLAKEVIVEFPQFGNSFATIIIAVIVLNQIAGPPLFKLAIKLMKEDRPKAGGNLFEGTRKTVILGTDAQASALAQPLPAQGWQARIAVNGVDQPINNLGDTAVDHLNGLTREELKRINCLTAETSVTMCSDDQNYNDKVLLDHGSGGKISHVMFSELIQPLFDNPELNKQDDGAVFEVGAGRMAFSTDSYVVDPLFFPGGNIGELAVNGTVNDVAMSGARPLYISVGMIIEEGLPVKDLKAILESMAGAAQKAGVRIVTGDTKVVPRGKADKIFINTSGVGVIPKGVEVSGDRAEPGDKVIISGTIADHGITILSEREGLKFDSDVKTDSAPLNHMVKALLDSGCEVHVLRDPTRGGLGTTLNEIAGQSGAGIRLFEDKLPVRSAVKGTCELLGVDPLYVANEGKLIAIVPEKDAERALEIIQQDEFGKDAVIVGAVMAEPAGRVILETLIGGTRIVDMLTGEQLPRIC